MLSINVAQQLKEPIGSFKEYNLDEVLEIAGKKNRVTGEIGMVRTDRGILVKACLDNDGEVACSRCLREFNRSIRLDFEEEYLQTVDLISGNRLTLPEEPGCFIIDQRHILNLTEAVRQYTLLSIPMKTLCREDCAGLCSACGQNLNLGPCQCPTEKFDPRWAPLLKLGDEWKGKK